jgi:hypothetical protein
MLHDLDVRLLFRRISVEQARGTPLLEIIAVIREMILCQRLVIRNSL